MSTTSPELRSFIDVDNDNHFPIQNLPYGAYRTNTGNHICSTIGDYIVDLNVLADQGFFNSGPLADQNYFSDNTLNRFMGAGKAAWQAAREELSRLLRHDNPDLRDNSSLRDAVLRPISGVDLVMPVTIGDYTDFYSSKEHATNVGTMFRGKENALMPNWVWIPVGYHGRASSVVISGTDIRRPQGQTKADDADAPVFGPCRLLDFELEMGFFTGPGNALGSTIGVDAATDHIFGMVLVNDWSARDIQKWEYVPLGPFLAKNFATSISPWIVTMDALAPFRTEGPAQNPAPLPYLKDSGNNAYDINLEVHLKSAEMDTPTCISHSNHKYLYWNVCQQLAHHTVTGCNIQPGDLLASGTISGPTPESYGSMLELTWRGSKPLQISNGQERKFLLDGDTLSMTGWCQGNGYRVGFGEVTGTVLPAKL